MRIRQILNNNAVMTLDNSGSEIVAMGKGIAFSRKKGERVDPTQVEKIFTINDIGDFGYLKDLINEIPIEYFITADKIVQKAKLILGKPLNQNIHILLSDHLYGAVVRQKRNKPLTNILNHEIKRFYTDEYAVGLYAINLIKKEFNVELLEDEAGFIALHLFNAQMDGEFTEAQDMAKMIKEILTIVRDFFNIELDEENVQYFRFMTHLKFFAYRVFSKQTYEKEDERDLLALMSKEKPEVFRCVSKIEEHLHNSYKYKMSSEEKLYLVIHISKVITTAVK